MLTSSNITEPRGGALNREPPMPIYKAGKRDRAPTHPGAVVRDALEALDKSVNQAALAMGLSRQRLWHLTNEQGPVTPETALLVKAYLGIDPELLLTMQVDFDLWNARKAMAAKLAKIKPAARPK